MRPDVQTYTSTRVFDEVRKLDKIQAQKHHILWLRALARRKGQTIAEMIEAGKTDDGGWTRETLAGWGIPWPPPKGWKRDLLNKAKSY